MTEKKPARSFVEDFKNIVLRQADSTDFFICYEDCCLMLDHYDTLQKRCAELESGLRSSQKTVDELNVEISKATQRIQALRAALLSIAYKKTDTSGAHSMRAIKTANEAIKKDGSEG